MPTNCLHDDLLAVLLCYSALRSEPYRSVTLERANLDLLRSAELNGQNCFQKFDHPPSFLAFSNEMYHDSSFENINFDIIIILN